MSAVIIIDPQAEEIRSLHEEILQAARTSLTKAIRVGELLKEVKDKMGHGRWLPWLRSNTSMGMRTAQRYLKLYDHRERIEYAKVSYLSEAYELIDRVQRQTKRLTEGKPDDKPTPRDETDICNNITEVPPEAPEVSTTTELPNKSLGLRERLGKWLEELDDIDALCNSGALDESSGGVVFRRIDALWFQWNQIDMDSRLGISQRSAWMRRSGLVPKDSELRKL